MPDCIYFLKKPSLGFVAFEVIELYGIDFWLFCKELLELCCVYLFQGYASLSPAL